MKHTPGPWFIQIERGETGILDRDDEVSISIWANEESPVEVLRNAETGYPDQAEANAYLIAASPDLLEACKQVMQAFASISTESANLMHAEDLKRLSAAANRANSAILRAKGVIQ